MSERVDVQPGAVAVVRCDGYSEDRVRAAVRRGLDLLGGPARFARRGERILLKPNLLVPRAPERAVTTHPSVFRAVAESFKEAGAVMSYGDSPGFGSTVLAARRAGLAQVALVRGDIQTAVTYIQAILAFLDTGGSLESTEDPLRVYRPFVT